MFSGSFLGNLCSILYFLSFILAGNFIIKNCLKTERTIVLIWLGTVAGCVLLMWLPSIFAFVFGFNILSHILALILLLAMCATAFFIGRKKSATPFVFDGECKRLLILLIPMLIYYIVTLNNHTLLPVADGSMLTGQSTYGDMNLHLSFITTPVAQGTLPFHYNILPSANVSYPFLSDTISSSLYIWGSSIRLAYMLPLITAAFTVFSGAFLFFNTWLKSLGKSTLAWILFFFNGGFGFFYFLDGLRTNPENFTRIFTEYYQTPTNLADNTVRWVNSVVDMMIPQRATLFGWMMLFAGLYLLYRAVFLKEKRYFLYSGIAIGLTPLINTHVFLSLGIICAVWLLSRLASKSNPKTLKFVTLSLFALVCIVFLAFSGNIEAACVSAFCTGTCALLFFGIYYLSKAIRSGKSKYLLSTWGVLLLVSMTLALPQLFGITFKQTATNSSFMFPHFNWVNDADGYIWFYIKNIGLPLLLLIPALFSSKPRNLSIAAPAALLILLADTISLQPNTYDNNKLLYPAFALLAGVIACYMVDTYNKLKQVNGTKILAAIVLTVCTLSAVLTMGREVVSATYTLYSAEQLKVAEYINKNTEGTATILTNDRHNNAISSLTGRDIVCGTNTFLYFHGHGNEYAERQADIEKIYANPADNIALLELYSVDYVLIGPDERYSYDVDEAAFAELFEPVYSSDDLLLYKIH